MMKLALNYQYEKQTIAWYGRVFSLSDLHEEKHEWNMGNFWQ